MIEIIGKYLLYSLTAVFFILFALSMVFVYTWIGAHIAKVKYVLGFETVLASVFKIVSIALIIHYLPKFGLSGDMLTSIEIPLAAVALVVINSQVYNTNIKKAFLIEIIGIVVSIIFLIALFGVLPELQSLLSTALSF